MHLKREVINLNHPQDKFNKRQNDILFSVFFFQKYEIIRMKCKSLFSEEKIKKKKKKKKKKKIKMPPDESFTQSAICLPPILVPWILHLCIVYQEVYFAIII